MGIIPSRNLEEQRREENGVVYFDRGVIAGRDGRKYDRYAIQTHFVQRGEDQAELVRRYVAPLYREGDMLSFGAKVMAMCTNNVKTRDEVKPGLTAKILWRFAGINTTGVGMHEPYKLQLVVDMVGAPRVWLAAIRFRGDASVRRARSVLQDLRPGRGRHRRFLFPFLVRRLQADGAHQPAEPGGAVR